MGARAEQPLLAEQCVANKTVANQCAILVGE